MPIIENFSLLSEEEQRRFANTIVEKLNVNKIFLNNIALKVDWVEASDISGALLIGVAPEVIRVAREATWACEDKYNVEPNDDVDINYEYSLINDIKSTFKTKSAVLDGYRVSLDITEYEEHKIVDYEVEDLIKEDSGIGNYEYFGFQGYDSNEYLVAEGTIYSNYEVEFGFIVEAE